MLLLAAILLTQAPGVTILKTPNGGIQPQAVLRGREIHLIYYKGDPAAGDLEYVRSGDEGQTWTSAVAVNSIPRSAVALGNIRGGQIAIGPNGGIGVVWNGSGEAAKAFGKKDSPLLFAEMPAGKKAFSKALDMMGGTHELDGGATVAIDAKNVTYVIWHATDQDGKGEVDRAVWVAAKDPGEAKFTGPQRLEIGNLGACGCCSMKALGTASGFDLLYRSATEMVNRDTWLIRRTATNAPTARRIDPWKLNYCPMSTFSLAPSGWLAFETQGKIRVSRTDWESKIVELSGTGKAKHPVLAVDGNQILCAWTEGMSWSTGGTLRWAILDPDGKIVQRSKGEVADVPRYSLVTAFPRKDGGFTILD